VFKIVSSSPKISSGASHLARIIHELTSFSWIIRPPGFDSGLYGPPLRANLERARSTLSKPATKTFNLLRVLIHESKRFVNNAS
jgi:hypothetical protein